MNRALFIVGPTASGKTELAINLASKFHGEIISCDSVQVYKNLNIISGKDIPQGSKYHKLNFPVQRMSNKFNFGYYNIENIPIYLIDLVSPDNDFSVSDYIKVAVLVIENTCKKKLLPIVVGGTFFYAKALIDGINTLNIPPDPDLRKNLAVKTLAQLQDILKKEDGLRFGKMNDSDRKNKRRLIRAIEVIEYKKISSFQFPVSNSLEDFDILMIGLCAGREIIKSRIGERVSERIRRGAVLEAENLFENYNKLSSQVRDAVGYRQLFDYLLKKTTIENAVENWRKAEYQTAKKQMTFLKKDERIHWFDIVDADYKGKIERVVSIWLKSR